MRVVVFSAVVLSVLATGAGVALAQIPVSTAPAAYTVEPFAPSNQITIQGAGVRLRGEPFATRETPVLSSGNTGLVLNVVGIARLPDWNWYQVVLKNGQKAFIRSDYTSAPSKGGASAAALPAATRIDYPPVSVAAPTQTTPAAPLPAATRIEYPPVSATAPVLGTSATPSTSDAPISLVPRSPNSGGLTSVDPALTSHRGAAATGSRLSQASPAPRAGVCPRAPSVCIRPAPGDIRDGQGGTDETHDSCDRCRRHDAGCVRDG